MDITQVEEKSCIITGSFLELPVKAMHSSRLMQRKIIIEFRSFDNTYSK